MKILDEVDRGVLGKIEVAKKSDITKSTLSTYVNNRDSIRAGYEKQRVQPSRKRMWTSAYPQLGDALVIWIKQVRSHNLPLCGLAISAKAREFTNKMAIKDFMVPIGWLLHFKECHGLTSKTVCGEKADADAAACEE